MELECVYPKDPSKASPYETRHSLRHVIFTAETHNFPTGQDNQSTLCLLAIGVGVFFPPPVVFQINNHQSWLASRCSSIQRCHHRDRRSDQRCPECWKRRPRHFRHCRILLRQSAHTRSAKKHIMLLFVLSEYEMVLKSVIYPSSLSIAPGYVLPWESSGEGWEYPSSFAPPLQVAVEASDGASDYGNKFGEPVLSGRELYWGIMIYSWICLLINCLKTCKKYHLQFLQAHGDVFHWPKPKAIHSW